MTRNRLRFAVAAALASSAGATTQVGLAQQETATTLEEIVVTATRREQDLQEVPVSIVAITGDNLTLRGIDDLEELGSQVPNINIQGSGSGTNDAQFRIRGIPNVGLYVDGVWQVSDIGFLNQEFVDLDRVEVLRGPQGTTYGRDSVGGAIRIWTARPEEEFGGRISATTGSLNRRDVRAVVDVPITENLLTKWTASTFYRDGYIQSLNIEQKNGGIDQTVFRGDLLWTPTDRLSMRFTYSERDQQFTEPRIQDGIFDTSANMGQSVLLTHFYELAGLPDILPAYTPENFQAGYPGGRVGQWENYTDVTLPSRIRNEQTTWGVEWDISDSLSLQFLTAYTEAHNDTYDEWDNSDVVLVNDHDRQLFEVLSEDIQLSGGGDRIEWTVGVYYWDESIKNRNMRYQIEEFAGGNEWYDPNDEWYDGGITFDGSGNPSFVFPEIVEGQHVDISNVFNSQRCMDARVLQADFDAAIAAGERPPPADCQSVYFSAIRGRYNNMSYSDTDGWAIFGDVTFHITDQLDLTFGARQHDQTEVEGALAFTEGVAPKPPVNQRHAGGSVFSGLKLPGETVSFDQDTYRLSLQYQFTDDIMGYASYSEGFNSGGVSSPTVDGVEIFIPYKPELLKNYEIGVRSDLAGGALRLNATLFSMDYTNIQAAGPVFDARGIELPTLVTTNVGKATAEGVEFELTALPTDNFMINLNVGLLDTGYNDILPGTPILTPDTEFQQAPETTYNVGFQYTANLSEGGTLTTRLDYSYTDQFWRFLPQLRMDWYSPPIPLGYDESGDLGTVNARISYEPPTGDWRLSVFGTNLTDEYLLNSGFFHGIWGYDFATVARPREAGVTFDYFFD